MAVALPEELIDAVYRAALEPAAWSDVLRLTRRSFPSAAQTFYLLHLEQQRLQPLCLAGIEPHWLDSFDALYFAPDNPWLRASPRLHRPGVVRTNERLDRFLQDRGVLFRSCYYNDWMRPHGFRHTIGNTLLAEAGVVANVTLLRPPDMKTFAAAEVQAFEVLSRHMTRALQMAVRLQFPQSSQAALAAFDAMPQPVAVVDAQRRVLYANAAMESLLARRQGLSVRRGELTAARPEAQERLAACVASALSAAGGAAAVPLSLPLAEQGRLTLRAMPIAGDLGCWLPWRRNVLLMATEDGGGRAVAPAAISQRYGCTLSEARLAQCLVEGLGLRESAQALGITYGTARAYLKIVFDKTGVGTQAQLVARLLGGAAPVRPGRGAAGARARSGA